jgi:hypothetical protein
MLRHQKLALAGMLAVSHAHPLLSTERPLTLFEFKPTNTCPLCAFLTVHAEFLAGAHASAPEAGAGAGLETTSHASPVVCCNPHRTVSDGTHELVSTVRWFNYVCTAFCWCSCCCLCCSCRTLIASAEFAAGAHAAPPEVGAGLDAGCITHTPRRQLYHLFNCIISNP